MTNTPDLDRLTPEPDPGTWKQFGLVMGASALVVGTIALANWRAQRGRKPRPRVTL